MTDLRSFRSGMDTKLEALRTRMDDKLEGIRKDLGQFAERLAAVETRVQALEDFIHRIGLSEDYRTFREQQGRRRVAGGDGGTA